MISICDFIHGGYYNNQTPVCKLDHFGTSALPLTHSSSSSSSSKTQEKTKEKCIQTFSKFSPPPVYFLKTEESIDYHTEGSFGTIYLTNHYNCHDQRSGKIIFKVPLDTRLSTLHALHFEELILSNLETAGVRHSARIFTIIEDHVSIPFSYAMVMDYYGENLRQQKLNFFQIQSCMRQFFETLADLERLSLCHGDLKPDNALWSNGQLTIIDWGAARRVPQTITSSLTTIWYRAPEFFLNENPTNVHYDASIDVWSLGCIFYELVTGQPLFRGYTSQEMIYTICSNHVIPNAQVLLSGSSFKDYFVLGTDGTAHCKHQVLLKNVFHTRQVFVNSLIEKGGKKAHSYIDALDLFRKMLKWDPKERIKPAEALKHPFFTLSNMTQNVKK